jgi:hypothetical protein
MVTLILNTGNRVDLIGMDNKTVHNRDLKPIKDANILETAKQLYKPLSSSVQVTDRAREVLNQILKDKEILAMARIQIASKKSAKANEEVEQPANRRVAVGAKGNKGAKSAAAPAKAAKPAKKAAAASNGGGGRSLDDVAIRPLVKQNPCREGSFCYAQVDAALTSKSVAEAQKKLDKSGLNPNGRRIEIAWLVSKGYIKTLA